MTSIRNLTGKKLINTVDGCVDDCLAGLVASNDQLLLVPEHRIVIRRDYEEVKASGKVTLLSGGGSGHEPTFAGFVGKGMLTAAVAGSVFTSPPANNTLAALRLLGLKNTAGTLIVVANYTGDRLNFGLAAEQAKNEGYAVETFLVAEDCAMVGGVKATGRRGLCGIVLVVKIAGAMAEEGKCIQEIVSTLQSISANLGTIGMSLSPCSLPGAGPTFTLRADEMELGLGVHGEAGVARLELMSARETVDTMFGHMTKLENPSRVSFSKGDRVAMLVNNLGGTSQLEMYIAAREAIDWLETRDVLVERVYVANLMTSLEMAGFSLTILKADPELISLIDSSTAAPGWPRGHQILAKRGPVTRCEATVATFGQIFGRTDAKLENQDTARLSTEGSSLFRSILEETCNALILARNYLNELDSECGDGDCGNTLSCGATLILQHLEKGDLDICCPSITLRAISDLCQKTMGGTSGALYAIFFATAASVFEDQVGFAAWTEAIVRGTAAVSKYGGAKPGDRTMLDGLHAVVTELGNCGTGLSMTEVARRISVAARKASDATIAMEAHAGRASYVGGGAKHWTRPDPGAEAVAIAFDAIRRILSVG